MIFRKNYLPALTIYQDFDGKWFAEGKGVFNSTDVFVQYEDLSFGVENTYRGKATRCDTLDDLLRSLYEYAYKSHLEAIKQEITSNKVKVHL